MKRYVAAVAACIFTIVLGGCASLENRPPQRLTVLTYNIHHGEGTDAKLDLDRIARLIAAVKPDLVALQEIDQNARRSGNVDQAQELGRLTGMHHVFGKAMDFQGGAYGQAILSRWPIESHKVHILPQRPEREPRISLAVQLKDPMPELTFASVHLDHQIEEIRVQQAEALNKIFGEASGPSILAGDFNAVPSSETMRLLFTNWTDSAGANAAPTIPSNNPRRRIDYILVHPKERWRTVHSRVLDEAIASDHRAVLSVLEFSGR